MRIVAAVLSTLLTLMGCNERSKTTMVSKSTVDGVGVSSTRATISDGSARFQCLKSPSGHCHYVLFLSDCPGGDSELEKHGSEQGGPGRDKATCSTKLVDRFMLAAGRSKKIAGLPKGFKFCVGYATKPVVPGCLQ